MIDLRPPGALDAEVVTMRHATREPALVRIARRNGERVQRRLIAVPIAAALYFVAQLARWALT